MSQNPITYAAIDIGSNAVRLLIKSVNPDNEAEPLSKVQLVRVPLRLGGDAFTKGKISKKKAKQLISLMKAYKELMFIYDVQDYRACATSAMRDSANGKKLADTIYEKTGIVIEILKGEEEAELLSDDRVERLTAQGGNYLYVDVGGGSTELNLVVDGRLRSSHSFNIGTVRLLSEMVKPGERQAFSHYLRDLAAQYDSIRVVGTGGNINKLVRLAMPDPVVQRINILTTEKLMALTDELKQYSPGERMVRFGLKPDRTDVIVPAADIFVEVLTTLHADDVIVPISGLSDGIIDRIYLRHHGTPVGEPLP